MTRTDGVFETNRKSRLILAGSCVVYWCHGNSMVWQYKRLTPARRTILYNFSEMNEHCHRP